MYNINSNILTKSGYSAAQLAAAEKAFSPGNGYHSDVWQAIVDAENKWGINALFILAHADVESAHGNSHYALTRNNLFGFNAVDSNPDNASSYASEAASILYYANFLDTHYLTPGAVYYNGDTPHGIFVKYSSSHDAEATTVVQIMNALAAHISGNTPPAPVAQPAPAPTDKPSASTYTVPSGSNLTRISALFHGTNPAMWVNANLSKYPQITSNFIESGWVLNIPGGSPSVPTVTVPTIAKYVVAKKGDTVSGWGFKAPYTAFLQMNPQVTNASNIFAGQTYRVA